MSQGPYPKEWGMDEVLLLLLRCQTDSDDYQMTLKFF